MQNVDSCNKIKQLNKFEIIKNIVAGFSDEEIWQYYAACEQELQNRKLVRTRNIVGERGEFLAVEIYGKIPGMPKLQAAPEGTQNVDALSRKGERYSIKTITNSSKTTGVFYGCGDIENPSTEKKFEFIIIVIIDKNYQLKNMYEINWEQFINFRKWHKTMRAWNLTITTKFINEAKVIF
jgi:hypothetical protein